MVGFVRTWNKSVWVLWGFFGVLRWFLFLEGILESFGSTSVWHVGVCQLPLFFLVTFCSISDGSGGILVGVQKCRALQGGFARHTNTCTAAQPNRRV